MVESLNSQSIDTFGSRFSDLRCYQPLFFLLSHLKKAKSETNQCRQRKKITKLLAFASLAQAKSICPVASGLRNHNPLHKSLWPIELPYNVFKHCHLLHSALQQLGFYYLFPPLSLDTFLWCCEHIFLMFYTSYNPFSQRAGSEGRGNWWA